MSDTTTKPTYRIGDTVSVKRHGGEVNAKIIDFLDNGMAICEVEVKERFAIHIGVR